MAQDQAPHLFLFTHGIWVGEGKISFTASPDELSFYTKWQRKPSNRDGEVRCTQQVEMNGVDDKVENHFRFYELGSKDFKVELHNELVGHIHGKGVYSAKEVAWEFRGHPSFEGFEVYRLREDGDWAVHAEFASPDQFRTVINGRVWKMTEDAKT